MRSTEKSHDLIGNPTRDLPACSVVPQPTTLPCVLHPIGIRFESRAGSSGNFPHSCHRIHRENNDNPRPFLQYAVLWPIVLANRFESPDSQWDYQLYCVAYVLFGAVGASVMEVNALMFSQTQQIMLMYVNKWKYKTCHFLFYFKQATSYPFV
jgi:hypothetical protein